MNKTSRSASGLDWHSTGQQTLGRTPFREGRFGLAACILLGGLGAAMVAPTALAASDITLHTFTGGSNGQEPAAGLIFDGAGNLYGTAVLGGTSDDGIVFELSPASGGGYTETVLHNFIGSDGANPTAGLIFDSAGNLYGTTNGGGTSNFGTVFELSPASGGGYTETVLYSFTGRSDGAYPSASLIFDSAGNLYGTTQNGGTSQWGTVFKLSRASGGGYTETVLHSFTDGGDGAEPEAGLVLDGAGNLYGTTPFGGPSASPSNSGAGTVFALSPAAGGAHVFAVLHSFTGGSDGSVSKAGLILDGAGNLFGTTYDGGTSASGTAFELSPASGGGFTEKVLYSFTGGSDASGPEAGLIRDSAGNLYGTTFFGGTPGHGTVFELSPASGGSYTEKVLYTFTGGSDGEAPSASLVFSNADNLYGTAFGGGTSKDGTVFEIFTAITGPAAYNFGNVAAGNTSTAATLTLKIGSAGAVSFSSASLSGANSADFTIGTNHCTGTIAAGKSCTLTVTFTPSAAAGTAESATLSLTDNAASTAQTIALSGTSTVQIAISPASIGFGAVAAGSTSVNHTLTIENRQASATSLAIAIGGANRSDFVFNGGTCTTSLKAFGSCSVILDFTPSAPAGKAESAALSITDNAASSPQTVALSGTSSTQVAIVPTSINFGTVAVGSSSANHTLIIENHQPSAISLSTAFTGANPSDFALNGGTCGTSLKAFSTCTLILDFSPGATGNRSAILNLTDSPDSNSPHAISLTGKGG